MERRLGVTAISAVLPAYDEAENIVEAVREVLDYLSGAGLEHEVIVVNDGSLDSTGQLADGLAAEEPSVRVVHHPINLGYGQAICTGFAAARHDLLFFTDSDRQFDVGDLSKLIPLVTEGGCDIAAGRRLRRQDSLGRKFSSWCYNSLARSLLGIEVRDINCAFKLFRRDAFERLEVEAKDFLVNAEILAKARLLGFAVAEVGVRHLPRRAGTSTVRAGHALESFKGLLRIRRGLAEFARGRSGRAGDRP